MKRLLLFPLLAWTLLLLSGCGSQISAIPGQIGSALGMVKTDVEQIHDLEAQALQTFACNTTVGTLRRNPTGNPRFGDGVLLLCPERAPSPLPVSLVRP